VPPEAQKEKGGMGPGDIEFEVQNGAIDLKDLEILRDFLDKIALSGGKVDRMPEGSDAMNRVIGKIALEERDLDEVAEFINMRIEQMSGEK